MPHLCSRWLTVCVACFIGSGSTCVAGLLQLISAPVAGTFTIIGQGFPSLTMPPPPVTTVITAPPSNVTTPPAPPKQYQPWLPPAVLPIIPDTFQLFLEPNFTVPSTSGSDVDGAVDDLAYMRPTGASSFLDMDTQAMFAVDGDNDTAWEASSSSFPQWLALDLRAISYVSAVEFVLTEGGVTWKFKVQGGNTLVGDPSSITDPASWDTLLDYSQGIRIPRSGVFAADIDGGSRKDTETLYRFVRIVFLGAAANVTAGVMRFSVYGAPYEQPTGLVPPPVSLPAVRGEPVVCMLMCNLWGHETHWIPMEPFPERLPNMGFYNEAFDVAVDWDIKMMVEHGVTFTLHCWYRLYGNQGQRPVMAQYDHFIHAEAHTAQHRDYLKFAINWVQGQGAGVTDMADFLHNMVPHWIEEYFQNPNYYKDGGNKPVLAMQDPDLFITSMGGVGNATIAIALFRAAVRAAGFADVVILGAQNLKATATNADWRDAGFNFIFGYHLPTFIEGGMNPNIFTPGKDAAMYQERVWQQWYQYSELPSIVSLSVGWNSTPWGGFGSKRTWQLSPAEYEVALASALSNMRLRNATQFDGYTIVIDGWNEFAEGHSIAPTFTMGYQYVQAMKKVLRQSAVQLRNTPTGANTTMLPDISVIPQLRPFPPKGGIPQQAPPGVTMAG